MIKNGMRQRYSLTFFIDNWEKTLDKPHKVIFEKNIGTISYYFLERLKTKKIKNASTIQDSDQKELLNTLQKTIHSNGIETKILRCRARSAIRELGKTPNQPKTKLYLKYFKKIDKTYDDPKFVKSVRTQMLKALDSNEYTGVMNECAKYLIRSLLRRYSTIYLKKEIPKVFSRSFFELHSDAIRGEIKSSGKLRRKQTIVLNHLYNKTLEKLSAFSSSQKREKYLRHLHLNSPSWNDRDLFFMILNAKKMMRDENIIEKVRQTRNSASESDIYAVLDQPALRNAFHEITKKACFNLIFNIVSESHNESQINFTRNISKLEFCREFSSLVKSVIYPRNTTRPYENFDYDVASFSHQIFSETYSKIIQAKISEVKLQTLTTELLRQMSIFFANESLDSDFDILNKFEINRIVTEHARKTCHGVFKDVLAEIRNTPQEPTVQQIGQSFISDLLEHFFDKSDRYLSKIHDLTKSQMRHLITSFCEELQKPRKQFRVYCLIGGLNCDQKYFQIEDVIFYDSRTWDFGENVAFDRTMGAKMSISENLRTEYGEPYDNFNGSQSKRNSARAVVNVTAYDQKSAISEAEIQVQNAANSLVYASTAFTERGFKPQIPVDYVVIFDGGESARKEMGPRKQDHGFLTMNDDYLEISKFHDLVFQEPPTKLNDSILRALEWYNRGHWSEIAHQKFVLLWVALDQLIHGPLSVKESHPSNLLKYIPKLIVTWRYTKHLSLSIQFRAIMKSIRKEPALQAQLDSNPRFKGWRQNDGIVLKNLKAIVLPPNSSESKYASAISRELPSWRIAIKRDIRKNRERIKFKIALLTSKRNSLVHEGLTHSEELDIMSGELEKILVYVIDALIRFSDKRQLNKIIYENNRPIHVHD